MTAIAAFLRKTPVIRLQDYFTAGGFTSLAPIDWPKPEPEVVETLIKAVDAMSDGEKQRVVLDAARVAALADEPGQNALQNVVVNRAVFDTRDDIHPVIPEKLHRSRHRETPAPISVRREISGPMNRGTVGASRRLRPF